MKFLCLVHFLPDAFAGMSADDQRRLNDATIAHDQKLRSSGHLLIASPLDEGETIIDRRTHIAMETLDGPFAESKELIGGFILIEANDMAEAVSMFDDDPIAAYGRLQIRPLYQDHQHSADGTTRPDFKSL